MESRIVYFENPGAENTEDVLSIAKKRAEELGIGTILVASTTGKTALKAVEVFRGLRVIAVSHVTGMISPDTQEFTEENRKLVEGKGGLILTTSHAFAGVSRAVRKKFGTHVIGDIIANTLRVFGEGMKVVCEISLMAADSGLVRTDEDVIAIGGSGSGADTAVVLRPVNAHNFFELKVKEILCKPRF
jgi:hypothetical protein